MKRKFLSILLVFAICLSLMPQCAFAQGFTLAQSVTRFEYSGTTLHVTANVTNSSLKTFATGYAAVYNQEGILKAATTKEYSVGANKTEIVTYTIENYTFAANDYIRLFLWDVNHAPLAESVQTRVAVGDTIEGIIVETTMSYIHSYDGKDTVSILVTASDSEEYPEGDICLLDAPDTDIYRYLGYSVTAIVNKNEDDSHTVLSYAPKAANKTVTIPTYLIDEIDSGYISYFQSDSSRYSTEAEIHPYVYVNDTEIPTMSYYIVINGFNSDYGIAMDFYDIVYELDEITLLDNNNDGAYDFIFANAATDSSVEFVVDYIENDEGSWYFEDIDKLQEFEIDYDDHNDLYCVFKDGKAANAADIAKGDVITIFETDTQIYNIYVSSKAVTGMIDEIDSGMGNTLYTINDSDYTISPISYYRIDELDAGDEATFYINAFGKIAYVLFPEPVRAFYYITDTAVTDGVFGDNDYLVKAIDASGNDQLLTIQSRNVEFYSEDYELEGLDAEEAYDMLESYNPTLVMLSLSESGKITAIYLPGCDDHFLYEDRYENDSELKEKHYNEARGTYGIIDLTADTIVFDVDSINDVITATTVGELFLDDESYSFIAYGDLDNAASALVTFNATVDFSEIVEPEVYGKEYVYLIDYATDQNDFDQTVYYVQAMTTYDTVTAYRINKNWIRIYTKDGMTGPMTDDEAYSIISAYTGVAVIDYSEDDYILSFYLPDSSEFSQNTAYERTAATYNSTTRKLDTVSIDKNTIVFAVDSSIEDLDDALSTHSAYKTLEDKASYTFTAYGKEGQAADIILIHDYTTKYNAEAPVMVVTKVSKVVVNKKESIKITGVQSGSAISVIVDPAEYPVTTTIAPGNVIVYADVNGYAANVSVLFTSTLDSTGELMDCDWIIKDDFSDEYPTIHFGEITDKTNIAVTIDNDEFYFGYDMNVIVVDYTGTSTSIKAGTRTDVKISNAKYCYTAFIKTDPTMEDDITDIVIFKNEA